MEISRLMSTDITEIFSDENSDIFIRDLKSRAIHLQQNFEDKEDQKILNLIRGDPETIKSVCGSWQQLGALKLLN